MNVFKAGPYFMLSFYKVEFASILLLSAQLCVWCFFLNSTPKKSVLSNIATGKHNNVVVAARIALTCITLMLTLLSRSAYFLQPDWAEISDASWRYCTLKI